MYFCCFKAFPVVRIVHQPYNSTVRVGGAFSDPMGLWWYFKLPKNGHLQVAHLDKHLTYYRWILAHLRMVEPKHESEGEERTPQSITMRADWRPGKIPK